MKKNLYKKNSKINFNKLNLIIIKNLTINNKINNHLKIIKKIQIKFKKILMKIILLIKIMILNNI
jgi:hypothetical protein